MKKGIYEVKREEKNVENFQSKLKLSVRKNK